MRGCKDFEIKDGILTAEVKDEETGIWKHAEIKITPGHKIEIQDGKFIKGPKVDPTEERDLVPLGDWVDDAKECTLENGILKALLKDNNGEYQHAEVKVEPGHNYENINGEFHKNRIKGWDKKNKELQLLPGGNWSRNCKDFELKDGILSAEIKDENGDWKHGEIKVVPGLTVVN